MDGAAVSTPASCTLPDLRADKNVDLLARYNSYFRSQGADTPQLLRTALAIRYQVYCLERKFEKAEDHGDHLECDDFDAAALHSLVIHRPTEEAIGTARLILPRYAEGGLPIEQLLRQNGFNAGDYFPLATSAEVSRFSISNQFRRRRIDNGVSEGRQSECRGALPCLGLIQEIIRQSHALGLTHWLAVMEPKLLRMMAAIGFAFTPVGPLVSYHGLRQPSYACIPDTLARLKREHPDHWMVATDEGRLMPTDPAPVKTHMQQYAA
jgi:N-acyl amino acid synthase of PEP-CTERM/exosortase system